MSASKQKPSDAVVASTVEKTKNKAEEYVRDPEKAKQLLEEALKKAKEKEKSKGSLADLWNSLTALFRLLQAYIRHEYTDIPWGSIVMVVVAIIYFVSPIDLIPDWIPIAGYIDDAAVIAFVIRQIKVDLDNFIKWEAEQTTAHPGGTA